MAPRPAWKGFLKLSLVTCAVELTTTIDRSEKVSFRILNRKTGNAVKRQYVDAVTGKPVEHKDEVKGYEVGDDEYLRFEEDELDAVQIESSHTLSIDSFVDRADIDPIYFDTPYYLTPADENSQEAFLVIREAMARQKKAGLARIVLFRRERPVMVEPFDRGLLLTTLRYAKMVRLPDEVMGDIPKIKIDPDLIELATHIIDKKAAKFDPSGFEDRYENALLELIAAKQKGKPAPKAPKPSKPTNVVSLFDALKKSLADGEEKETAKPKAASAKRPARKKA